MNLNQNGYQTEFQAAYYNEPTQDIRREPKHGLLLFLILLSLFAVALGTIFILQGKLFAIE
jgi:hypothetical protein